MGSAWVTFHTLPWAYCQKTLVSPLVGVYIPLNKFFPSEYPPVFPAFLRFLCLTSIYFALVYAIPIRRIPVVHSLSMYCWMRTACQALLE